MKNYLLAYLSILLIISSCVNQKSVSNWLEKNDDFVWQSDTTYIDVPLERTVTVELPGKTIFQTIDCDDITANKPLVISDSTGLELEISKIKDSEKLQVVTRQKTRTITKTVRDTIKVPVSVEKNANILFYENTNDSLRNVIKNLSAKKCKKSLWDRLESAGYFIIILFLLILVIGFFKSFKF